MTNDEAIKWLKVESSYIEENVGHGKEILEAYDMAIKALEQQPCEDCISREEVQDLISRWLSDYLLDETREALETINYKVGDMPSVTPERPKGKWMECGGDEPWLKGYCCSLCNFTTTQKYDYCTCGAKMEVNADEDSD